MIGRRVHWMMSLDDVPGLQRVITKQTFGTNTQGCSLMTVWTSHKNWYPEATIHCPHFLSSWVFI